MAADPVLRHYLTSRRVGILCAISEFAELNGYAPTVREIQETIGLASPSTIHVHLGLLRAVGLVEWVDGQSRTLHITPRGRAAIHDRVL